MSTDADLARALGRIEGKQDLILARIDAEGRLREKLEERVTKVEQKLTWYVAYAAGGAAVIAFALQFLKAKIMGAFST
jgi:hypothetical protein